jgi:glyoxylase-like metal-dependent hydrolase (beta-lactamase superfamily II)
MVAVISFSANSVNNGKILPPLKQLSDHVYAWIGPLSGLNKENQGYRMNLLFTVGKDAVAVVDTGYTEAMVEEMLGQIKRITDVPVKYAINSNPQPYRFMGNPAFRQTGATIIAHQKTDERMKNKPATLPQLLKISWNLNPVLSN